MELSPQDIVWNQCLSIIHRRVDEKDFKTWFSPITPLQLKGKTLTIQVPSQFFYEYLEEHYLAAIKESISTILGRDGRLEYSIVVDKNVNGSQPITIDMPTGKLKSKSSKPMEDGVHFVPETGEEFNTALNRNYTFDNYIEGDYNRLARSAGFAVAIKPGVTSFNPLMVYGGSGLGKTHLVHAIGNELLLSFPYLKVQYVSSNEFMNQYIEATRANDQQSFINYYFALDVLIIDDVQYFGGKEKTQEFFFHIFNHLHQANKQVIMTSDRAPKDLVGFQERLLNRFKWGLNADLQQPDFETKIAIIHTKMKSEGIKLSQDVIEYLAYSVDTNIRELEGVLVTLLAQSTLNRKDITLDLAKDVLKNIIKDIDTEVSIDYIQKSVAEYFGVKLEEIKAKTRKKEIVIARQVAMYFCKELTNHSLKNIGYHFNRDHSTVIHAVTTVNDMMDTDSKIKSKVEDLHKKLKMRQI